MKPIEEKWTRHDIMRMLLAPRPKPPQKSEEQKAQEAWAQSLEAAVKASVQSNRRALERTKAELEEAERERNEAEYHRRAQIANWQAIELGYAQQQAEALAARRYDPLGLYGDKSRWDD